MEHSIVEGAADFDRTIGSKLSYRVRGDKVYADLTIKTKDGGWSRLFRAEADWRQIADELGLQGEVSGWSLKKLWKKAKKIARKTVKSKVWRVAEKTMTKLGPLVPPPYGPAVVAAGTAMKASRALISARRHAKAGRTGRARAIVRRVKRHASRSKSRGKRMGAAKALKGSAVYYLTLTPGGR